jgi:predicted anti-sigma-YlaC factor YlaD
MHLSDETLILHYYGELPAEEGSGADTHLAACAACRAEYARLQRVLAAVNTAPVPERAPGYEADVWARLQPRLPDRRPSWWAALAWRPGRWALAGGLAALVLAAFVAGRFWPARPSPEGTLAVSDESARERILLVAVGAHLEETQMVLIELVNASGPDSVDVSAARAQAADLVEANRLYRQTAEGLDPRVAGMLDELEPTLVEVARSPRKISVSDWNALIRSIEAQGLLFKLRVVSQEVREREEAAVPPQGHAVS